MVDTKTDYEAAVAWAKGLAERQDWLVLDTETTGLDDNSEVLQIAVLQSSGRTLFKSLVKPVRAIPAEVTAIHGISDWNVEHAPPFGLVLPVLSHILSGKDVIGYNMDYDQRILGQSAMLAGIEPGAWAAVDSSRATCAMLWYAQYVGEWNDYRGDYRWQTLPRDPQRHKAHDAEGDCLATIDLIHRMAGKSA